MQLLLLGWFPSPPQSPDVSILRYALKSTHVQYMYIVHVLYMCAVHVHVLYVHMYMYCKCTFSCTVHVHVQVHVWCTCACTVYGTCTCTYCTHNTVHVGLCQPETSGDCLQHTGTSLTIKVDQRPLSSRTFKLCCFEFSEDGDVWRIRTGREPVQKMTESLFQIRGTREYAITRR